MSDPPPPGLSALWARILGCIVFFSLQHFPIAASTSQPAAPLASLYLFVDLFVNYNWRKAIARRLTRLRLFPRSIVLDNLET